MPQILLWPTLAVLAGVCAIIPAVQNTTTRSILYWLVLSPLVLGLVSVVCLSGVR